MPTTPRIVISGLSGGAGKSMVSIGLARALTRRGLRVQTFKKGPDYIDAAWLALAAGTRQATLDPFFSSPEELRQQFAARANADICLLEGNRGLFDGLDALGTCSTAVLASLLQAPVLLVVDCTKMTRTVAALVAGCAAFDPAVSIGGVILNRVGRDRQEQIIRESLALHTSIPVLGCLPRRAAPLLEERHMGLTCAPGNARAEAALEAIADWAESHISVDSVVELAKNWNRRGPASPAVSRKAAPASPLSAVLPDSPLPPHSPVAKTRRTCDTAGKTASAPPRLSAPKAAPRIGYIHDAALWFYYAENLDALAAAGAIPVPLSILSKKRWPAIDGLYIGGGLPELHARKIAQNTRILGHIRELSDKNLPIYAECGGLMVLVSAMRVRDRDYPMAGIFPCTAIFGPRPQGIGYVEATVERETPFFPDKLRLRGHEFHFSRCELRQAEGRPALIAPQNLAPPVLRLSRGTGLGLWPAGIAASTPDPEQQRAFMDGLLVNTTYAGYTHLFAPAVPIWATRFVQLCSRPAPAMPPCQCPANSST